MSPDKIKNVSQIEKPQFSQGWYVCGFLSLTMAWTLWLPQKPRLWYYPQTLPQQMASLLIILGLLFIAVGMVKNRGHSVRGWFTGLLLVSALLLFPIWLARQALNFGGQLAPLLMAALLVVGGWFFLKIKLPLNKRQKMAKESDPGPEEPIADPQVAEQKNSTPSN